MSLEGWFGALIVRTWCCMASLTFQGFVVSIAKLVYAIMSAEVVPFSWMAAGVQ